MSRLAFLAFGTLLGGYVALCALAFVFQRRLLFPAPVQARPPSASKVVQVPGGTPMLWRAPSEPEAPVVLHFHGNGEQVADVEWLAGLFAERGAGFAAMEYPGYGLAAVQSATGPSEASIATAANQAVRFLVDELRVSKERLVLSGQSLGSGAAVQLAEAGWGSRLLLLTPYTSLPDVAARAFPWLPARWLMLDRFDSESRAPRVSIPTLVIHGTRDEVIPFELGRALAAKFPSARLLEVDGAGHNDLWERAQVRQAAMQFILLEEAPR